MKQMIVETVPLQTFVTKWITECIHNILTIKSMLQFRAYDKKLYTKVNIFKHKHEEYKIYKCRTVHFEIERWNANIDFGERFRLFVILNPKILLPILIGVSIVYYMM